MPFQAHRRLRRILRAIGIKQNIIVWSYVFQALFYTFVGVLCGSLLTFFVIAPYLAAHPVQMPIGDASLALERT